MSHVISAGYRKLWPEEIDMVLKTLADSWQDDAIPLRQYEACVQPELLALRRGNVPAPYAALLRCLQQLEGPNTTLLDVGCSSGYYSEVMTVGGHDFHYTGCDYSTAFINLARELYPAQSFDLADATALPYHDDMFDVVLSSACIMHVRDYARAIWEAARVARHYVILHRTPLADGTTFFSKEAYGVPCLEIHFSQDEILKLAGTSGLHLQYSTDVGCSNHRSFVFAKDSGLNHVQV